MSHRLFNSPKNLSVGSKRRIFRVIVKKNEFGAIVEFEEIESEEVSKEKSFLYRQDMLYVV